MKPALPSFLQSRLAASDRPDTPHPDVDFLTAFAERKLFPDERTAVAQHLAVCSQCRDVVALAGRVRVTKPKRSTSPWVLRLAPALAACCCGLVTFLNWQPGAPDWKDIPLPRARVVPAAAISLSRQSPDDGVKYVRKQLPKLARNTAPAAPETARAEILLPGPASLEGAHTASAVPEMTTAPLLAASKARVAADEPERNSPSLAAGRLTPCPFCASSLKSGSFLKPRSFGLTSLALPATTSNPVWSLDRVAAGNLRVSRDRGRTWQTIPVDGKTEFFALNAAGSEIWVGGAAGMLFHSIDAGATWTPLRVTHEPVISIEGSVNGVVVTTRSGMRWTFK